MPAGTTLLTWDVGLFRTCPAGGVNSSSPHSCTRLSMNMVVCQTQRYADIQGTAKLPFNLSKFRLLWQTTVGFRGRFPWPRKVSVVRREQIRVLIKTAAQGAAESSNTVKHIRKGLIVPILNRSQFATRPLCHNFDIQD